MTEYRTEQPTRDEIDATTGPLVLAFGTQWCGHCMAAERHLAPALGEHPDVPLVGVEDGRGRPLGRSFHVKLWPTLVFLRAGVEVDRVVRPSGRDPIDAALARITAEDSGGM